MKHLSQSANLGGPPGRCTAFEGQRLIRAGALVEVVRATKKVVDNGSKEQILIFDDETSQLIEVDFRGTWEEVVQQLPAELQVDMPKNAAPEKRGPGRPKLGVVGREVTLLPRHWDWLDSQPGGASVALRRLVEAAKKANQGKDKAREAQEAAYSFMSAMAGDLAGYEEALRALYAGEKARFGTLVNEWPAGIRDHSIKLAERVFTS